MRINTVRKTFMSQAPYHDASHAWTLLYRRRVRLAVGVQPSDGGLDIACGTDLSFRHLHDLVGAME